MKRAVLSRGSCDRRMLSPLFLLTFVLTTSMLSAQQSSLLERIDHLVYATPNLDRGVKEIEDLLGVRAATGGQHPGRGTRNALVALGPNTYLEIIAPDPDQPAPPSPRAFGLDTLTRSRLVTWAAKTTNVNSIHARALANGISLGRADAGSRKRPDGVHCPGISPIQRRSLETESFPSSLIGENRLTLHAPRRRG